MFNADRAYAHTANLTFPRRTGSDGEEKAARYIKDAFRALGLTVEEQPFGFSYLPLTIASRLILLVQTLSNSVGLTRLRIGSRLNYGKVQQTIPQSPGPQAAN